MSKIEQIRKYIMATKIPDNEKYGMYLNDMKALYQLGKQDIYAMLSVAFQYGRAKGYRAAKREVRA